MTLPSDTPLGTNWLSNFHEQDRPSATLLLDALRVVSLSDLWSGLDGRSA